MIVRLSLILIALLAPAGAFADFAVRGTVLGPGGALPGSTIDLRAFDSSLSRLLGEFRLSTDAFGRFAASVPPGRVELDIRPPEGIDLLEGRIRNLEMTADVELRVALKVPVAVRGRVESSPSLAGATEVEIFGLTTEHYDRFPLPGDGSFETRVPADVYSFHAFSTRGGFSFGRVNADLRGGAAAQVVIPIGPRSEPILTHTPPNPDRISLATPDANGVVQFTGAAGAVEPLSKVLIANLETKQFATTISRPDGSFRASLFAPPGSSVQIKCDPTGKGGVEFPPAILVTVTPPPGRFGAVSFIDRTAFEHEMRVGTFETRGVRDPGQWSFTGDASRSTAQRGETITYSGPFMIDSKNIDATFDLTKLQIVARAPFEKLFNARGEQRARDYQFMTPVMTPTSLPIEFEGYGWLYAPIRASFSDMRLERPGRISANLSVEITIPDFFGDGVYAPLLELSISGIDSSRRYFDMSPSLNSGTDGSSSAPLPPLRIGSPATPRLFSILFADDFSNGARGQSPKEDLERFRFTTRVVTGSDMLVLPARDARTGAPIRYSLEPFVPLISAALGGFVRSPMIPFRFPSGEWHVEVRKPSGAVVDLGAAPFTHAASRSHLTLAGLNFSTAPHAAEVLQLRTGRSAFEHSFDENGIHQIVARGFIEDLWGNRYEIGGTFEIAIARPLDFEFGSMIGTPFVVGDAFAPTVILQPPIAADVEIRWTLAHDGAVDRQVIRGRANRFGFFSSDPIPIRSQGEYRVDLLARGADGSGETWIAAATWGNVVERRDERLITHGRRGFDNVPRIQDQWFFVRQARAGGDHVMFPFHGGDVMWLEKHDPAADIPKISVQDPLGSFSSRIRAEPGARHESPSLEERISAGEIPLFSTCRGCPLPFEPERIDPWGYFYGFAERPGVRIREFISEDASNGGYWRFTDPYHFQIGSGTNGDLPNDFKFHFGGAVWRDARDGFSFYGAYASLFVLLPLNDEKGGRVLPPFQGNGGGPSGGPLFTLKGKTIDIFFHPTGVRPGSVMTTGNLASFVGQVAPTVHGKVELTITSPTGIVRRIAGQANKVGYFYQPSSDFRLDEPGVWRVKTKVWFDGVLPSTSGQVTAPFPTGDVLGSREGEFYVYVVRPDAPQLEIGPMQRIVRPADGPIAFIITPPAGWTNVELYYTTTMPGFILEEGATATLRYTYDAPRLAKDFPNLDLHDADGFAGADTITISFLVTGLDAAGRRQYVARQIGLQGEELQMPEQKPSARKRGAFR